MERVNKFNKDFAEHFFQCSNVRRSFKFKNSDNEAALESDFENSSSDLVCSINFRTRNMNSFMASITWMKR